ncbi:hypothetical protein HK100_000592 [Physocladia obscura]|uniref:P-loop containing nucleoside triphosphate hydrolase protein n=1 Tax=Physocladia obscura TaxID=109957 RepID=A0AAD5SY59_9FUNG|nr:hypothetical protein HK100_000592 [Physocladia obscura]
MDQEFIDEEFDLIKRRPRKRKAPASLTFEAMNSCEQQINYPDQVAATRQTEARKRKKQPKQSPELGLGPNRSETSDAYSVNAATISQPPSAFAKLCTTFSTANSLSAFAVSVSVTTSPSKTQAKPAKAVTIAAIAKSLKFDMTTSSSLETLLSHAKCIAFLVPNLTTLISDYDIENGNDTLQLKFFDIEAQSNLDENSIPLTKKKRKPDISLIKTAKTNKLSAQGMKLLTEKIRARFNEFKLAISKFCDGVDANWRFADPEGTVCWKLLLEQVSTTNTSQTSDSQKISLLDDNPFLGGEDFCQDLESFLENLRKICSSDFQVSKFPFLWYNGQIEKDTCWTVDNEKTAVYENLKSPLPSEITLALKARGITRFYSHQAKAINEVQLGKNVIVSTSTASGKSLIYQIPTLTTLLTKEDATFLFIFPTKALAQDQLASMKTLFLALNIPLNFVATLDGDTLFEARSEILETARVIFTNFDFLHKALIRHTKMRWARIWDNLVTVVVDELHCYSGGRFGILCAGVVRRLKRVCGARQNFGLRFLACSATVGVDGGLELMEKFFGLNSNSVTVIQEDGAPTGRKHRIIWNPPAVFDVCENPKLLDSDVNNETTQNNDKKSSAKIEERIPIIQEAVSLCLRFLLGGIRFICFVKTRNMCEILLKEFLSKLDDNFDSKDHSLCRKIMSYRGGYSKEDRRDIERRMFDGELCGIIATNALELGIDIGSLDVVVHLGFPYNIASYRQQSGRAGRRKNDSASILIADPNSGYEQFLVQNPDKLFNSPPDPPQLKLTVHRDIIEKTCQCAAAEIPFTRTTLLEFVESLYCESSEEKRTRQYDGNPAKTFQIRTDANEKEEEYRVIDIECNTDVEYIQFEKAFFVLYEGAVFINKGQSYLILEVSHELRIARAQKTGASYVTKIRDHTLADPYTVHKAYFLGPKDHLNTPRLFTGLMKITTVSTGYKKLHQVTHKVFDIIESGGETNRITAIVPGFWIENLVDPALESEFVKLDINAAESVHAAGHALFKSVVQEGGENMKEAQIGIMMHCNSMLQNGNKM